MKETRIIMGMPVEIEVVGSNATASVALAAAFEYFVATDERFSTYKKDSEISRINRGELALATASAEMREVFALAEKTKKETNGYFDICRPDGSWDPSGIVKGWAIRNVAELIFRAGCENYFLNVGGDIASCGKNAEGKEWSVGIRNPFNINEIVKVVFPYGKGVATSGSYIRGAHIYNPHAPAQELKDIVSITVIGPDVFEADRFATAAFAMGKSGIAFVEHLPGFEGYAIDAQHPVGCPDAGGIATMTSGFNAFCEP